MIFQMVILSIPHERMQDFMKIFREEYLPIGEKYGRKLIAQWRATTGLIGPAQIYNIWGWESMAAREKFMDAGQTDQNLISIRKKWPGILVREESILLKGTANSPLK